MRIAPNIFQTHGHLFRIHHHFIAFAQRIKKIINGQQLRFFSTLQFQRVRRQHPQRTNRFRRSYFTRIFSIQQDSDTVPIAHDLHAGTIFKFFCKTFDRMVFRQIAFHIGLPFTITTCIRAFFRSHPDNLVFYIRIAIGQVLLFCNDIQGQPVDFGNFINLIVSTANQKCKSEQRI